MSRPIELFCSIFSGESPLTESELNLAELVVDKWKCYQYTSLRVSVTFLSGNAISYNLLLRIIQEYFQPKIDRK